MFWTPFYSCVVDFILSMLVDTSCSWMLNRKVNLGVWRRSPSKTEVKAVVVIQAETAWVEQTYISTKLEFIWEHARLFCWQAVMTEQQWPKPGSGAVLCFLTCDSNRGPQPRLARAVSSGSVCAGTRTAGQCNLLRLQPERAMRGCCHWLSLDCCHSQAVSSRKLPLSLSYILGFSLPHPLSSTDTSLTYHWKMEWHSKGWPPTHTATGLLFSEYTCRAERGEEVHVQLQQETCIHPFLSPTTNLKDKMRHIRSILSKASPSRNEKPRLHLRSREEKHFLKSFI